MIKPVCNIINNDALEGLKTLDTNSVDCIITSPPYWNLRDYRVEGQLGREPTIKEYLDKLIAIFKESTRVLKDTGTLWINLGDTFASNRIGDVGYKSLCKIPDRFCIRMIDELGLINRADIIWWKKNAMPQSATDRFTLDYEHVYMFTKISTGYYFKTQYEPYSSITLEEIEKDYNGNGLKDYEGNDVQNPSNAKRNIINSIRTTTGYNRDLLKAFDNAKKLGWNPEECNYAEWYFNQREKKGWHDHSNDQEQGFGQQSKGQKPPILIHPNRIRFGGNKAAGYGRATYSGKEWFPNVELGRVKRSVWTINTIPYTGAHFAVFPEKLVLDCMNAGCPEIGTILDPFAGAATTGLVALKNGRNFIGIEINKNYIEIANNRLRPYIEQTRLM